MGQCSTCFWFSGFQACYIKLKIKRNRIKRLKRKSVCYLESRRVPEDLKLVPKVSALNPNWSNSLWFYWWNRNSIWIFIQIECKNWVRKILGRYNFAFSSLTKKFLPFFWCCVAFWDFSSRHLLAQQLWIAKGKAPFSNGKSPSIILFFTFLESTGRNISVICSDDFLFYIKGSRENS